MNKITDEQIDELRAENGSLRTEVAKLREPVAAPESAQIKDARAYHLYLSSLQGVQQSRAFEAIGNAISAYDTLAQDCAKYANAHTILCFDVASLKEKIERSTAELARERSLTDGIAKQRDVHMAEIAGLRRDLYSMQGAFDSTYKASQEWMDKCTSAQERERQQQLEIARLREHLDDSLIWLRSALDCKSWSWDVDQWNAADEVEKSARAALSPHSPSGTQGEPKLAQPDGEKAKSKSQQELRDECFATCSDYSCVRMGTCTGKERTNGPV